MANAKETSRWTGDQLMNMLAKKTRTPADLITELQAMEFPASQETETFARELLMRLPQKKNAGGITAYQKAEKEAAAVVRRQQQYQFFEEEEALRGAAVKKQKKDEKEERKHKKEVVIKREPEAARERAREQDRWEKEQLEERLREKEAARKRAREQDQQEKEQLEERLREKEAARKRAREQDQWEKEQLEVRLREKDAASTKKVGAHLVKTEEVIVLDELDEVQVPPQGHDPAMESTSSPQLGCSYTRHEIFLMLGGGQQTFLPTKNGLVLCGCFTLSFNPGAPTQVLIGPGPMRNSSALMAVQQGGTLPIFMKQAKHAWEYVGEYHATRYVDVDRETAARVVREAQAHQGTGSRML